MIRAKIIGATGYGGVGLVELLLRHPQVEIATLCARDDVGHKLGELYPHLRGFCDLEVVPTDSDEGRRAADVVFFSTPDRVGMHLASTELERGAKVIDYSGDFRFSNPEDYAEYARRIGKESRHATPELLDQSVYGLPELGLERVDDKSIVGNPGCFAVSCLLSFAPAVAQNMVDPASIIFDCKTGVSGAGKKPHASFHYPARYDNMNAYKLAGHQHVCEIERYLSQLAGRELAVTFTAQVVPATRGILSCGYGRLADDWDRARAQKAYESFYAEHPFVCLFDPGSDIGTATVRGSNHCALIVDVDERTRQLRVISHIDNLMKGQAGSALQNMNLLFGFPETQGLDAPGSYP